MFDVPLQNKTHKNTEKSETSFSKVAPSQETCGDVPRSQSLWAESPGALEPLWMGWKRFRWRQKELGNPDKMSIFQVHPWSSCSCIDESPTCETKCVPLNKCLLPKKADVLGCFSEGTRNFTHRLSRIDLSMRLFSWLQKIVPMTDHPSDFVLSFLVNPFSKQAVSWEDIITTRTDANIKTLLSFLWLQCYICSSLQTEGWKTFRCPKNPMDPRVFLLICLAAASRHQPSASLEVDPNDPQNYAYNEADFQVLRDLVNNDDFQNMHDAAEADMWPSFLKAHPEEGWHLFKKLAKEKRKAERWQLAGTWVRKAAAVSPAWPMLLETHNVEAWQLFQELAADEDWQVRKAAAISPAWPMLLETHNAEAWQLFQKLAQDKKTFVKEKAAISPAWPMLLQTHTAEAWQLFQKLAQDKDILLRTEGAISPVREGAATSPAWPMLLETHTAEAWQLFQELAQAEAQVREKAAESPAWPILLETYIAEAWQLFQKLAKDGDGYCRVEGYGWEMSRFHTTLAPNGDWETNVKSSWQNLPKNLFWSNCRLADKSKEARSSFFCAEPVRY